MGDYVTVDVKGFKELEHELMSLPTRIARNTLARAVYAGAAIVRDDARSRVPVKTGNLRRNIRIYKSRGRKGQFEAIYRVGPNKKAWYGGMVERGDAKGHWITVHNPKGFLAIDGNKTFKKKVWHPGIGTAKPFLRPAFDNNRDKIIEAMRAKLQQGIEKEAAKARMAA